MSKTKFWQKNIVAKEAPKKVEHDPDEKHDWFWENLPDVKKYSEDQPRDDHGRFSTTGSDGFEPAHISYIRNAVQDFYDHGGTVKLVDNVDELKKINKEVQQHWANVERLPSKNSDAQARLESGASMMAIAVADVSNNHRYEDGSMKLFAAYAPDGILAGVMSFGADWGSGNIDIGSLGSTGVMAHAGTALEYELTKYVSDVSPESDIISQYVDSSLSYHEKIGRSTEGPMSLSMWTAEQVQEIAAITINKKSSLKSMLLYAREILKYSPDQPRDDHGRFGSTNSGSNEKEPDASSPDIAKIASRIKQANAERVAEFKADDPAWAKEILKEAKDNAQIMGYSSLSSYKKEAVVQLQKFVDDHHVIIRIPDADALLSIIRDNHLQNGFQSGASERPYMLKGLQEWRINGEQRVFGIPADASPAERPVYGIIGQTTPEEYKTSDPETISTYGAVELQLKDEVKDRTSVCVGDSLDTFDLEHVYGNELNFHGVSMANNITTDSIPLPDREMSDILFFEEHVNNIPYVEAQVHGQITLDDIASVNFNSIDDLNWQTEEIIQAIKTLDERGIPWTIENAKVTVEQAIQGMADEDPSAFFEQQRGLAEIAARKQSLGKLISNAQSILKYSEDEPRDEQGRWTDGGGSGGGQEVDRSKVSAEEYSRKKYPRSEEAEEHPKKFTEKVVNGLLKGQNVNISSGDYPTLLKQMAKMAKDPEAAKADITNLLLNNTYLIGKNGLGLPRSSMPQIPEDRRGQFFAFLRSQDIGIERLRVDPTTLQPSQQEISGPHAGEMFVKQGGKIDESKSILVSSDGYVIDGHHHWASAVGAAILDPEQKLSVIQIGTDIHTALQLGLQWDKENGIALEEFGTVSKAMLIITVNKARAILKYSPDQPRDSHGRFGSGGGQRFESIDSPRGSLLDVQPGDVLHYPKHGDITIVSAQRITGDGKDYVRVVGTRVSDGKRVSFPASSSKQYPIDRVGETVKPEPTPEPTKPEPSVTPEPAVEPVGVAQPAPIIEPTNVEPSAAVEMSYDGIVPGLGKFLTDAGVQFATAEQWRDFGDAVRNGRVLDAATWDAVRGEINGLRDLGGKFSVYDVETHPEKGSEDPTTFTYTPANQIVESETLQLVTRTEEEVKNLANWQLRELGLTQLVKLANDIALRGRGMDLNLDRFGLPRGSTLRSFYSLKNTLLDEQQIANLTEFSNRINTINRFVEFGCMTGADFPSGRLPITAEFESGQPITGQALKDTEAASVTLDQKTEDFVADQRNLLGIGYDYVPTLMSLDQMQQIKEAYANILKDSAPVVMVDSSVIGKIVRGDALGNLFTENKTGAGAGAGEGYRQARIRAEGNTMGYSFDTSGDGRPVYGFMEQTQDIGSYVSTTGDEFDLALWHATGAPMSVTRYDENGKTIGYSFPKTLDEFITGRIAEDEGRLKQALADRAKDPNLEGKYTYSYDDKRIESLREHTALNETLAKMRDMQENPQNYIAVKYRDYNYDHHKWFDTQEIMSRAEYEARVQKQIDKCSRSYISRSEQGDISRIITQLKSYKAYDLALPDGSLNKDVIAWLATQDTSGVSHFGDSSIVLKNSVLQNTTVTAGDSLDDRPMSAIPYPLAVSADPRAPIPLQIMGNGQDYAGSYLGDDGSVLSKYPGIDGPPRIGTYYEAQIGGLHPTLSDIEKIVFTNGQVDASLLKKLDAAGVKYDIAYPNFDPKAFTKIDPSRIPEKKK